MKSVWGTNVADLFQKATLLYNIGDCLHLYTLGLVDVLEGVEILSLFVLYDADLGTGETIGKSSGRVRTFPKAPFPTHLRRTKWKRLTSPSKSIGYEW